MRDSLLCGVAAILLSSVVILSLQTDAYAERGRGGGGGAAGQVAFRAAAPRRTVVSLGEEGRHRVQPREGREPLHQRAEPSRARSPHRHSDKVRRASAKAMCRRTSRAVSEASRQAQQSGNQDSRQAQQSSNQAQRSTNQDDRQAQSTSNQANRQTQSASNQDNRQSTATQAQSTRASTATEMQSTRASTATQMQGNYQGNYYGSGGCYNCGWDSGDAAAGFVVGAMVGGAAVAASQPKTTGRNHGCTRSSASRTALQCRADRGQWRAVLQMRRNLVHGRLWQWRCGVHACPTSSGLLALCSRCEFALKVCASNWREL